MPGATLASRAGLWQHQCSGGGPRLGTKVPTGSDTSQGFRREQNWLFQLLAVHPCRVSTLSPLSGEESNKAKSQSQKTGGGAWLHNCTALLQLTLGHISGKRSRSLRGTMPDDALLQVRSRQSIHGDKGQDSGCLCGRGY